MRFAPGTVGNGKTGATGTVSYSRKEVVPLRAVESTAAHTSTDKD
jgi:hypothetical protein